MNYYEQVLQLLKEDGVYEQFVERYEKLSNLGLFTRQAVFDIMYETYKINGKRMFE